MLNDLIARIAVLATGLVTAMGYPGVALLMAVGSACIPLPSEVVMPFAGFLVSQGVFSLLGAATAGAVGVGIGSSVAWAIGRVGGRPLVERYGRYILIDRHELATAERFFARWGAAAVLIGQMIPVVRAFIAFPAGIAGMAWPRFVLCAVLGAWPWCLFLAWVGSKLGERWDSDPRLREAFHSFDVVIVGAALVAVTWFVRRKFRKRRNV